MRLASALLAFQTLAPRAASACAVCFGADSENAGLAQGLTWGLFVLLGSTFALLTAMVVAVVRIERRRLALQAAAPTGGTR